MSKVIAFTRAVDIFAASCSGASELAQSLDLPIACVRVSIDAGAAIEAMNAAAYACAGLWSNSFQPFEPQDGWRDWRQVDFGHYDTIDGALSLESGRIRCALPALVTTVGFEIALHFELRRYRVDEVTTSAGWIIARSDAQKPFVTPPRYTLVDVHDYRAGTSRVDDLFVCEPRLCTAVVVCAAQRALAQSIRVAEEARDGH